MNKGPRGRCAVGGVPDFGKIDKAVVKRLLSYIFKDYKKAFFLVFVCIIISSIFYFTISIKISYLLKRFIMSK
mgnify:CR=1 FL=1